MRIANVPRGLNKLVSTYQTTWKEYRGGERYISVKVIEVREGDRVEAFAMYAKTDTGIDTDTDIDTETEKETRCRDAVQSDQNRHVQTSCTIQICDPQ